MGNRLKVLAVADRLPSGMLGMGASDWARIGHEIENERHDWGMRILLTVIFYGGALVQLLRPVDPAINFPQRITGFGIMRVRIWRVIKYWLALVAIIFALSFVFGIDLPS